MASTPSVAASDSNRWAGRTSGAPTRTAIRWASTTTARALRVNRSNISGLLSLCPATCGRASCGRPGGSTPRTSAISCQDQPAARARSTWVRSRCSSSRPSARTARSPARGSGAVAAAVSSLRSVDMLSTVVDTTPPCQLRLTRASVGLMQNLSQNAGRCRGRRHRRRARDRQGAGEPAGRRGSAGRGQRPRRGRLPRGGRGARRHGGARRLLLRRRRARARRDRHRGARPDRRLHGERRHRPDPARQPPGLRRGLGTDDRHQRDGPRPRRPAPRPALARRTARAGGSWSRRRPPGC